MADDVVCLVCLWHQQHGWGDRCYRHTTDLFDMMDSWAIEGFFWGKLGKIDG